jgi:competence protein ComEA
MLSVLVLVLWAAVDLNAAGETEIAALPGIGPSKARAIVDHRTAHGAFRAVDELDDVPGIGPATIANLRGLVSVEATAAAPSVDDPTTAVPIASATGVFARVNVNTADGAALERLPGIGPSQAQAILEHRGAHGPFAACSALAQVPGLGPATLAGLMDYCAVK